MTVVHACVCLLACLDQPLTEILNQLIQTSCMEPCTLHPKPGKGEKDGSRDVRLIFGFTLLIVLWPLNLVFGGSTAVDCTISVYCLAISELSSRFNTNVCLFYC